jgi:hypothetical protein
MKRAIGMGLVGMPLMTVGMNTIPKHLTAQGSAFSNLFRNIAASIGIPILVSVMTTRQVFHAAWLADTVNFNSPATLSTISKLVGLFNLYGIKVQYPYSSTAALGLISMLNSKEALVCGMQDAFIVAAALAAVALPLCLFLSKKSEHVETEKQKQRFPFSGISNIES